MRAVGQPFSRLGTTYGVCAKTPNDNNVRVTISFGRNGKVHQGYPPVGFFSRESGTSPPASAPRLWRIEDRNPGDGRADGE